MKPFPHLLVILGLLAEILYPPQVYINEIGHQHSTERITIQYVLKPQITKHQSFVSSHSTVRTNSNK